MSRQAIRDRVSEIRHHLHRASYLALALTATMGCAPRSGAATDDRIQIVATIGMIANAAEQIGGERVRVEGLMGPGIDPHLYRASAGDVRLLAGADIILFNGLHLEAAMGEVLEEMGERVGSQAVTDMIDRDVLSAPPEFKGLYDPHVWFDVRLWMDAVRQIEATLSAFDPTGAEAYRANAEAYLIELEELDRWVRERLAGLATERRVLITAHDAFNYFGRAYNMEVRGLQGINTAAEAGTADVQNLVEFIVERRIPTIFVETSVPRRTIEAVQAAVRARGFEVEIGEPLFSDAMGNAGTPEGTYIGMVRYNVNTIVDALKRPEVAE